MRQAFCYKTVGVLVVGIKRRRTLSFPRFIPEFRYSVSAIPDPCFIPSISYIRIRLYVFCLKQDKTWLDSQRSDWGICHSGYLVHIEENPENLFKKFLKNLHEIPKKIFMKFLKISANTNRSQTFPYMCYTATLFWSDTPLPLDLKPN